MADGFSSICGRSATGELDRGEEVDSHLFRQSGPVSAGFGIDQVGQQLCPSIVDEHRQVISASPDEGHQSIDPSLDG
jgi:hypothetical protein